MKQLLAFAWFAMLAVSPVSYLKYKRPVHIPASAGQQHVIAASLRFATST